MNFVYVNNKILPANIPAITIQNRGYKWGDGVFETMKVRNGTIHLASYHLERLLQGLQTLQFELPNFFTPEYISEAIISLCSQNNTEQNARVRLNVFRGNGSLSALEEKEPCILIESAPMPEGYDSFNEQGFRIDIYKAARKSCDIFSNLKSNNYLPYLMAANYAKQAGLNDCLLLNSYDRICDASIANIFWVKNKQVFTPPLSEGCVAGVMRRHLMEKMRGAGYALEEMICVKQKLLEADEIFLTNALFGIRWVQQFRDKTYTHKLSAQLYHQFV
jgi:branched-chain amino acid aminotransferase